MLNLKEIAKTIEESYCVLSVLKIYCNNYEEIDELFKMKIILNNLLVKIDNVYAELVENDIL